MSFLGGSKKRDLSDKSRDGEDSKKIREQSDSLSSLSDDVFADGLNSPEIAKLLVGTLRNIESQVRDLFKLNEEAKNSQIKVTESLEDLKKKFNELEIEIKNQDSKIEILENKVETLEEEKGSLVKEIDELEQYSRRNWYMASQKQKVNVLIALL